MSSSFGELYKIMGEATKVDSPFLLGTVKSQLPNFEIEASGIVLDKYDLKIDNSIKILNDADITCNSGTINHNLKDVVVTGDTVLLVRVNGTFIVLCKVVGL